MLIPPTRLSISAVHFGQSCIPHGFILVDKPKAYFHESTPFMSGIKYNGDSSFIGDYIQCHGR